MKCEMIGEALSHSRHRDFWKEVRKLSNSAKGRRTNAPVIDGLSDDVEIAGLFSSKLEDILNSGRSSAARSDLVSFLNGVSDLERTAILSATVSAALSQLRLGKSEGTSLLSNHFICASPVLKEFLSKLFTAMLRHGYVPNSLRDCILQPIPKPGKDPSNSDNYRPIALAPTLSKVFELCLLNECRTAFATSTLQFGFKQGFSTDLCTGLIKNVISRYCKNGSTVHGCFLDASKAFDRVDHSLLFKKLLQRKLSPVVVRILLTWYMNQRAGVLWNGSFSHRFSISNGVRQGGVLSPILFTVYIDNLLLELEKEGVGCFWNHHFAGAVCYADDIALIAPSASALRLMLRTCTQFASSHSLIFNASKTQLIKFSCISAGCDSTEFRFLWSAAWILQICDSSRSHFEQ